jgi:hypothetical protein
MIEFRKSLNLAASQLENHLDYALEEFGQKCVRQGPVPLVPLRDGLGLRLECEKKNQRVKTRPTDYCFVYLRIRGAVPSNDDDTSHINSLTLVHLSSWVRPLWRVVRITATEHFTLLYFDCFCRRFYISFLHRITSFLPL